MDREEYRRCASCAAFSSENEPPPMRWIAWCRGLQKTKTNADS